MSYQDARTEARAATRAQERLNRQMRAAGNRRETPEWSRVNARTDEALTVLSRERRAIVKSWLSWAFWLAAGYACAALTIMWLGTGNWAVFWAVTTFLSVAFAPWLRRRVSGMKGVPHA